MTKNKFVEDLRSRQRANETVRCPVGRFLIDPDADKIMQEGMKAALGDLSVWATTIANVFQQDFNLDIGEKAVRAHRNGQCSCERRGI